MMDNARLEAAHFDDNKPMQAQPMQQPPARQQAPQHAPQAPSYGTPPPRQATPAYAQPQQDFDDDLPF